MVPLFAFFVVFCVWFRYELGKNSRKSEMDKNTFIELENQANSTRKQSIDNLDYIIFSEKSIPINEINDNELKKIQQELLDYEELRILNLSAYTNTELKKAYGPANLNRLTEYDQNFIDFIRLLHQYASELNEKNYKNEAILTLEYSISIGSDVSASYKLLADLYIENKLQFKLPDLLKKAENLNSLMKQNIIDYLEDCID